MTQKNVLLCDIGKVLIGWDQDRLLDKVFSVTNTPGSPEIRTLFKAWNDCWDHGNMRTLARQQIQSYPQYEPLICAYRDYWEVSLDPVIEGTVDVLRAAKTSGYKLYAASNFSTDTFEIARPHLTMLDLFDGIQISGQINICKPKAAFFENMMHDFSFTASEALFIDDKIENIEGAQKLGITAIHFKNPTQLKADIAPFLDKQ